MGAELGYIHHVGHVVRDMPAALDVYRRLGFSFAAPAYPMIAEAEGQPPQPLGVANTHATFLRNFIEIATVVDESSKIPADAHRVQVQVPPAALPRVLATIKRTIGTLSAGLARFEGLHILVWQTPDVEASATQFDKDGIRHSGCNLVQRQIDTKSGPQVVPVRALEMDGEPVPEGRLAIAENPASEVLHAQLHMDHPNGAIDLIESILCVPDSQLESYVRRYQNYLGRRPRDDGATSVFDLENAQITLVRESSLAELLPGEIAAAVPAFVAYAVSVRDVQATEEFLKRSGFDVSKSSLGDIFVPAKLALGAAVVFREVNSTK